VSPVRGGGDWWANDPPPQTGEGGPVGGPATSAAHVSRRVVEGGAHGFVAGGFAGSDLDDVVGYSASDGGLSVGETVPVD